MSAEEITLVPLRPQDVGLLLEMIKELAEFEKLSHLVEADRAGLTEALFGDRPAGEAWLLHLAGEPVGYCLIYQTLSTFTGRPGIYLEDVYVRPEARGKGLGLAVFRHLARLARERGCGRLELAALDWNKPAIDLYTGLGAQVLDDWLLLRFDRAGIDRMAVNLEQGTGRS